MDKQKALNVGDKVTLTGEIKQVVSVYGKESYRKYKYTVCQKCGTKFGENGDCPKCIGEKLAQEQFKQTDNKQVEELAKSKILCIAVDCNLSYEEAERVYKAGYRLPSEPEKEVTVLGEEVKKLLHEYNNNEMVGDEWFITQILAKANAIIAQKDAEIARLKKQVASKNKKLISANKQIDWDKRINPNSHGN